MRLFKNKEGETRLVIKIFFVIISSFFALIIWKIIVSIILGIISPYTSGNHGYSANIKELTVYEPLVSMLSNVGNITVIFVVYLFIKFVDKTSLNKIGLAFCKDNLLNLLKGNIFAILGILSIVALGSFSGILKFNCMGTKVFTQKEIFTSLIYGIIGCTFIAFGEELLFRGYILRNIERKYNGILGLLISTIIFTLVHIQSNVKFLDIVDVFLAGMFLGYLYMKSNSLYISIGFHFMWDLLQINIFKLQEFENLKLPYVFIFNNPDCFYVIRYNLGSKVQLFFVTIDLILLMSALIILAILPRFATKTIVEVEEYNEQKRRT